MSVLKNLRSLSEMQFYKTAITIRKELTIWLLKDFRARGNYSRKSDYNTRAAQAAQTQSAAR